MENEIRYYLGIMKKAMETTNSIVDQADIHNEIGQNVPETFVPTYMVTAVKLPTGAIELSVNTDKIAEKIDYILEAYNDDMHLKTNEEIVMQNIMIV